MSLQVHVVGLGRQRPAREFAELLDRYPIVARCAEPARAWLGDAWEPAVAFDDLFDSSNTADIVPEIVRRTSEIAADTGCLYLVPGSGQIGDATVAGLAEHFDVRLVPGSLDVDGYPGNAQVVDALELAVAEQRFPFDAGLAALDPVRQIIVTNLRGAVVKPLATKRMRRALGKADLGTERDGTLAFVPETEPGAIRSFPGFEAIVAMLRSPEGCPWDREQTVETLIPMMVEEIDELREAFQVAGAAEQADELGDVLLHIVMIAQIARELHGFGIEDVLEAISAKMVRRHPHVFGDVEISSIDELYGIWQSVKDSERAGGLSEHSDSVSGG